jgi:type VI secretion system protein ImpK
MTDSDRPPGPFGRGERTIIRPNPGGRRPMPPLSPPATSTPPPAPGSSSAPEAAAVQPTATPVAPSPPASAGDEEWIQTPTIPQPAATGPRSLGLRLDDLVAPNENPIMRAAAPLLLLLGRLRVALVRASSASLIEQVAEAIQFFERDIRAAGVPTDQTNVAKYILCATADDIVQNIPAEDRHVWTQHSMLSRFFGERTGGVRFFQELDRIKPDPLVNYSLLELFHTCLALGFQGVHRTSPAGQATLQQIQRNLYETLRRVRPKVTGELSPRWQGQALEGRSSGVRVPVWAVASIFSVALFALYIGLRTLLGDDAEATAQATASLHPRDKVDIARRIFSPPPPPQPPATITQCQRLTAALGAEIAAGRVSCAATGSQIIIRVGDLILFDSGEAAVKEPFKPVAAHIAAALEKETGYVKVVGHSDSKPIRTVRFASNWELSLERAKAVGALLKARLSRPERLTTEGKGADVPIASNDTAEGRAKNRRVEIIIPRTD